MAKPRPFYRRPRREQRDNPLWHPSDYSSIETNLFVLVAHESIDPTTKARLPPVRCSGFGCGSAAARSAVKRLGAVAAEHAGHADDAAMEVIKLVVSGVKADPAETADGELYEAMGFVRERARFFSGRPPLDSIADLVCWFCMSWKTVTLDSEAYRLLKQAKRPRESFGDVVRRTFEHEKDPADYLEELAANPPKVDVAALRRRQDTPRRSSRPKVRHAV